jgi:diguanylate cyclase (GGDEF)-like protein
MEETRQIQRPDIPIRPLVLAFGALLVPSVVTLFFSDPFGPYEALLWLSALIPAFLLAYYRGWRGVAMAMAVGMGVLVLVQVATLILGRGIERDALFVGVIAAYIGIGLGLGILAELIHRERERAQTAALTDPLTGIPNRRYADLALAREFAGAERGRALTVVLFDLDHFKAFNDRYGHRAGDDVLRGFASVLMTNTRRMNLSARYGGEEFLTILSSTPDTGAEVFAGRVRQGLSAASSEAGPLTVSAGIAQYRPDMSSPEDLMEAADRALYEAKTGGRDRVAVNRPPKASDDDSEL